MAASSGAIPAALLRSLQRQCAPDVDDEDASSTPNAASSYTVLARGSALGVWDSLTARVLILGLLRQSGNVEADFTQHLPNGITYVANFAVVRGDASAPADAAQAVAMKVAVNENKIVLLYELMTHTPRLYRCETGASPMELEIVQGLHARDFLRAVGLAPVRCAVDLHAVGERSALMKQLSRYIAATKADDAFFVRAAVKGKRSCSFKVVNGHGEDAMAADAAPVLLQSILPEVEESATSKKKNSKKQKKSPGKKAVNQKEEHSLEEDAARFLPSLEYGDIAHVDLLVSLAPMDGNTEATAPVVTIPRSAGPRAGNGHFHAHCDALVIVRVDSSLQDVLPLLRQELHRQLTKLAKQLKEAPEAVTSVVVHQFPLVGAAFPLSLISSSTTTDGSSDESMEDAALLERLHHAFLQPSQQSLFRVSRGCSLAQQGEWLAASDVLYNVHEGIPSSGVSAQGQQGMQALVDGFYGYYHYMQQSVNDKGWGCAYRSLQTLASWLFVQHYTQQRFLSHEQIQRALVQMGDKPSRFQGSKEWIGSLEVGYVLDELFGVTFRSLSVSSGAQLPDVARELLNHFETQGTPVMMGGGQLAFTLLGVDYDPDSGTCAFLTLDPHYTGDEDLSTIQQQTVTLEGYKAVPCSWRKTTTFAKNSFYNLCLPQRPSVGV